MCGIVGYVGRKNAVPILMDGLRKLEYRGYDSAGVAFFENGHIGLKKAVGKLRNLEAIINCSSYDSHLGIGHTRWATHGKPSEVNSHPHCDCTGNVVVVHNGIIENYSFLKKSLLAEGHVFSSETDTEVIAHLIEKYLPGRSFKEAVRVSLGELKGTYAIAVMSSADPDMFVAARKGSPLIVGKGDGEYILASDIPAIIGCTKDVIFIEDDELVVLDRQNGIEVVDIENGTSADKEIYKIPWDAELAEKNGYPHFMLKEIYEQPTAVRNTYIGNLSFDRDEEIRWEGIDFPSDYLSSVSKVFLVSCGTSFHASLVGKFMIESLAKVPVEVDIASEFRYREPIVNDSTITIGVTQSGETADTLEAMRKAKGLGSKVLTICNVVGSTASREADGVVYTHAGPEIGVASTKTFTSQLVALYLFSLYFGRLRGEISDSLFRDLTADLERIPEKIEELLERSKDIECLSDLYWEKMSFFFLGRGSAFPIALEGALKLKEISYLHAEGYAGGEMKHGPIALVNDNMIVVSVAPQNSVYEKMLGNIEEIKTRDGTVIALATEGDTTLDQVADHVVYMPETNVYLTPILCTVPLQLFAYHIANRRGCDIDQPRNLAKCVTVE